LQLLELYGLGEGVDLVFVVECKDVLRTVLEVPFRVVHHQELHHPGHPVGGDVLVAESSGAGSFVRDRDLPCVGEPLVTRVEADVR